MRNRPFVKYSQVNWEREKKASYLSSAVFGPHFRLIATTSHPIQEAHGLSTSWGWSAGKPDVLKGAATAREEAAASLSGRSNK